MLQLIELGAEVEYIDIDTSKIPYTFSIKLTDKTYSFTVRYNDVGGFFTIDLSVANTGEVLAYGDPVRYGRPMFGPIEDERFPLPVIIPLCLTGDEVRSDLGELREAGQALPVREEVRINVLLDEGGHPSNRLQGLPDGRPVF